MVVNIHERVIEANRSQAGVLIDELGSANDSLWPSAYWPAMRIDRPLKIGAAGGHGPIRYFVEAYVPGCNITFRFTKPRGFNGTHGFAIEELSAGTLRLRHELRMRTTGWARLSWPIAFRWLHDALVEDALDCAEAKLKVSAVKESAWSWQVRLLRLLFTFHLLRRPVRAAASLTGR